MDSSRLFYFWKCHYCFASWRTIIILLIFVSFFAMSNQQQSGPTTQPYTCGDVNRYLYSALETTAFRSQGSSTQSTMLPNAISGDHLQICVKGLTCCTAQMEHELVVKSTSDFQKTVEDKQIGLYETYLQRTRNFDRYFRELIVESQRSLDSMFKQTYGIMYTQNSRIFDDLYRDLTRYYVEGAGDLEERLKVFYTTLYRQIFQMMNPQYQFDPKYWQCVDSKIDRVKPFGDIPEKMSVQIRRSFVAARAFVQALQTGQEVVQSMMHVDLSAACNKGVMRLLYCPHCLGQPQAKPCNNYCLNVMKGCLAYHMELNEPWNAYIDALMQLLNRIQGPFSFESVVKHIGLEISEAIMNFQEKSSQASTVVFDACGRPQLSSARRRRSQPEMTTTVPYVPPSYQNSTLNTLAEDLRHKLQVTKGFWMKLPYTLCNDVRISAMPTDVENCWNGVSKDKYNTQIAGDGLLEQAKNPEVQVDAAQGNLMVTQQVLKLRLTTTQLQHAYRGDQAPSSAQGTARRPQQNLPSATSTTDGEDEIVLEGSGAEEPHRKNGDRGQKGGRLPSTAQTDDEDLTPPRRGPTAEGSGDSAETGSDENRIPSEPGSGDGPSDIANIDWSLVEPRPIDLMTPARPNDRATTRASPTPAPGLWWTAMTEPSGAQLGPRPGAVPRQQFEVETRPPSAVRPPYEVNTRPVETTKLTEGNSSATRLLVQGLVLFLGLILAL